MLGGVGKPHTHWNWSQNLNCLKARGRERARKDTKDVGKGDDGAECPWFSRDGVQCPGKRLPQTEEEQVPVEGKEKRRPLMGWSFEKRSREP